MRPAENSNIVTIGNYTLNKNELLGKGSSATVYRGINNQTGENVAIKAIDLSTVNNQVTEYLLEGELKAHRTLSSPHIVKTHDIIKDAQFCYIIMQQCQAGTLKQVLQKSGGCLPSEQALEIFRKIVQGYIQIIDALLIHRDLKTSNILMKDNGDPVIIDFGYCEMIMGKRPMIQYNVGSPSYMSPEAYGKSRYSQKSDIWALGVILYEMLTGKVMDDGIDIKEYFKTVQKEGRVRINYQGMNPTCKQILEGALKVNPEERATIHKIKYYIDKSMVAVMQAKLNKRQSGSSNSSFTAQRNQAPKVISQGHILNNGIRNMNPHLIDKGLRSSISFKEKSSSVSSQHSTNNLANNSRNQNSTMIVQNLGHPPFHHPTGYNSNPPYRKTMEKTMPPHPPIKRIISVRQMEINGNRPMKKTHPVLHKTISLQPQMQGDQRTPKNNIVSLRII